MAELMRLRVGHKLLSNKDQPVFNNNEVRVNIEIKKENCTIIVRICRLSL